MNSKNKKVKSRNSRKLVKLSMLVIFILLACLTGYKLYAHYHKNTPAELPSGPTAEQIKQAAEVDANNKKKLENTDDPNKNDQPTTPSVSTAGLIEISAKQEANSTVTVTTKLPGISTGTCSLEIVNGTKTKIKTAAVIYQPEFSTCAGFSIPINEMGTGNWSINLTLPDNPSAGSNTVTLEVR